MCICALCRLFIVFVSFFGYVASHIVGVCIFFVFGLGSLNFAFLLKVLRVGS